MAELPYVEGNCKTSRKGTGAMPLLILREPQNQKCWGHLDCSMWSPTKKRNQTPNIYIKTKEIHSDMEQWYHSIRLKSEQSEPLTTKYSNRITKYESFKRLA